MVLLNFHPDRSLTDCFLPVKQPGRYQVILSSDDGEFGGQNRVSKEYVYQTQTNEAGEVGIRIYIPSRCAVVLKKI